MRYLILSDMHSNCDAFESVLAASPPSDFDAILVLGDLVGYGGAPNEVVEAVRALPQPVYAVRGNHDKVVGGIDDGSNFNFAALSSARWTIDMLTADNLTFLNTLPRGPLAVADGLTICHGSPLDEDAYVFSDLDAFEIFSRQSAPLTFFGHTHVPSLFAISEDGGIAVQALKGSGSIELLPEARYLLNPGSIGQPRDRNPLAAYMTYDEAAGIVAWHRVAYPIEKAQRRITQAGLPPVLAERLAVGM